ncbi:tetratricopeptide repeat protein [Marivita sp. S6314]|uniref:tetratricopeptide repeat protein n=1 Tax=Marivita sp. S6314 TaxID=2926406 RepID=UPI001FF163DF|nr:tetratricopeptide repeat protein [Marivita sp. S6314]MCK0149775.1 tetratricopeptide repeat protein [Marivita sp. S6314]
MRYAVLIPAVFSAQLAAADGCPVAPDHTDAMDRLYEQTQAAPDAMVARGYSNQMWELWLQAPDEPSQMMLDEGLRALRIGDFLRAQDRLNALVSYCPLFAEGYNQRAFLNYLRNDYDAALPDLNQALDLNPRHMGALTGKALTLIALQRNDEAQEVLKSAVALNPWISERALITEPEGDDL